MSTRRQPFATLLAASLLLAGPVAARADDPIDSIMDRSPVLTYPTVSPRFPKRTVEALLLGLDRPDAESKCAAAQAIALAHREGVPGIATTVAALLRELDRPTQPASVRAAVAYALVTLDAKQAADGLFQQLESADADFRELVEPALGNWGHQPIRTVWLERLAQPPPYRRQHLLAIRGLGLAKEERAAAGLQKLVLSRTVPQPVRLESARSLAAIRASGLEELARGLAAAPGPEGAAEHLLAASLLRHHQGDAAVRVLQALGRGADPTVVGAALTRLVELDTKFVVPLLESVLASSDANVRSFGVEVLFRQSSEAHLRLLAVRLSDPHPDVRSKARVALFELAKRPEYKPLIIELSTKVLAERDWRGQEQSAVLLAQLDHKPATKRLIELFTAERPEAFIAAAWAVRKLAVPETLPVVHKYVQEQHKKMLARTGGPNAGRRGISPDAIDRHLTQLVQFFGQERYKPADRLLREMLPRIVDGQPGIPPQTPLGMEARTAVAWSLGMIHEGTTDAALVASLETRILDLPSPAGSEHDRVRQMSAISIGRLKGKEVLGTLRRFYTGKLEFNPVNNACGWAVEQITGEPLPKTGTVEKYQLSWFITFLE